MTRAIVIRGIVLSLALLALSALVVDWNLMLWPGATRQTDDATIQGDPTQLRAKVAGYVAEVPVADYQLVHRGDLIYAIEDTDYLARVRRATADVATAEASVTEAEAALRLQTAQLGVSVAAIHADDAEVDRARLEFRRQRDLLHTESFLQRDYDNAAAAERRQRASLEGDQKALAAAQAQIDVLQAQLQAQRAGLDARRAALDLAQVNLGYTKVMAPFDGKLSARLVRRGAYVAPGTALISIVDVSSAWVVANFREVQLTWIAPGQPARVTVDALPGVTLRGHVDSLQPASQAFGAALAPDRAVGNFTKIVQRVPVKIVLDPRPDLAVRLIPGLSAEAWVNTRDRSP